MRAQNNIFGIHIINETDLEDAAKLVNSNGGQWGYVTLVIREDERDKVRWQAAFDKMRELKLIPIVRIATKIKGQFWEEPKLEEAGAWAEFLNSLNWVVKARYIAVFNEPNHAKEWGGKINPEEYAQVLEEYSKALKAKSEDFFILPAGFDAAAPNSPETMDAELFWQRMYTRNPQIFRFIDGWNSHSYPKGFTSPPASFGRATVKSFVWEIASLAKSGLPQNIPAFITETGWVHNENSKNKVLGYDSQTIGKFFSEAFSQAWSDKRVKAVTPFILSYQNSPFDNFSWKKPDSNEYYPQFKFVQGLSKVKGNPEQVHENKLMGHDLPNKTVTDSHYVAKINFQNTGQSVWSESEGFSPSFEISGKNANIDSYFLKHTKPGETAEIQISFLTPENPGVYRLSFQMRYGNQSFGQLLVHSIDVIQPPKLKIQTPSLFGYASGQDTKLIIYKNNDPVKEFANLALVNGSSEIELRDVAPGVVYRFVLVKPKYLPVQKIAEVLIPETVITFPLLLPLDRDGSGSFSWNDIVGF